jgi:hypothetical protein
MTEVFLDTSFAIAVTVSTDRFHGIAIRLAANLRESRVPLVTTQGILVEIVDSFSKPPYRAAAVALLDALEHDPLVTILAIDNERFGAGCALFAARPDKTWGLTDCISFHVMRERGVTDALTADRHFQQAGFRALLREESA